LNRILDAEPVDLARVSEEIRTDPAFESLVLRLAASLVLSPEVASPRLEEAAVVLGTDRLKILGYMWSVLGGLHDKVSSGEQAVSESPAKWTPEALYIASFLRCLGLDSPDAADSSPLPVLHSVEIPDLKKMLMRDFLALIPVLDPSLLIPRQTAVRKS
jgi:HD-like signal output (HDOD) protein